MASSGGSGPPSASAEDDSHISFQSLLNDPQGRLLFKNYLKSGHSEHHLTFWEVVQTYRQIGENKEHDGDVPQDGTSIEEQRYKRAQEVYGEFIANGTKSQINLTELQRMRVKEALEKPTPEIFDEAERTAIELIKGNFYSNFLKTPECAEWQASKTASVTSTKKKKHGSQTCILL